MKKTVEIFEAFLKTVREMPRDILRGALKEVEFPADLRRQVGACEDGHLHDLSAVCIEKKIKFLRAHGKQELMK